MDVTRDITEYYKIWIALAGVSLALGWRFLPVKAARVLLVAVTLVAALNYARWGPKVPFEKVDTYDLLHYYINAKYFDELGYYDLYPALILADHEANGPYYDEGSKYLAQDAAGHAVRSIDHAIARGNVVKATKFTPESWARFSADSIYLQRKVKGLNDELWRQLIQDHGFNGTTVWTMIAKPIATAVPVEWIKWLCQIDVVLLAGGLGAVAWAYGWTTSVWAAFFLFVTYSARWPTYSWAFLRYDYLAGLLAAMALLRKGHPFWAGVLTAWSSTLRLFPAMWMYGPGAKGFAGLAQRKVHRPLLVLLGGFLVGTAVLQGAAVLSLGAEPARVHFENMEDHNSSEQLSSRRIGLALALPFRGDLLPKAITKSMKAVIEDQKPLRFGIAGVLLLSLGWGLRRSRDDEAFAFGFLPFFLLTTASYYYYVARITLIVLHASDLKKPKHMFGLAWLFGLEMFSNWAETAHRDHRVFLVGGLAWGLTIYGVAMAAWYLWDARAARTDADERAVEAA
ncbi:MAG: hypothetical protein Q8P41_07930 [Pseudomonadota bacterium]|nr:hypothetical protein [Pseudomonadota bacterium]